MELKFSSAYFLYSRFPTAALELEEWRALELTRTWRSTTTRDSNFTHDDGGWKDGGFKNNAVVFHVLVKVDSRVKYSTVGRSCCVVPRNFNGNME